MKTSLKLFAWAAIALAGIIGFPTTAKAAVELSLVYNTLTKFFTVNLTTDGAGYDYTDRATNPEIYRSYVTLKVPGNFPGLTATGFLDNPMFTGAGTTTATVVSGGNTYIIIGNFRMLTLNSATSPIAANTTTNFISFKLTGGPLMGDVSLASFNDAAALDILGSFNGGVNPGTTSDVRARPTGSTSVGVSTVAYINPVTYTNVPLPVNLLSFTAAKASANRSLIGWVTGSEEGASYFEVERSLTGTASSFGAIGVRIPATNGKTKTEYKTYDEAPVTGANYYRLKMVDISGATTYSSTLTVRMDGRTVTEGVSLFPNPIGVEGQEVKLTVNVLTAQLLDYALVDMTGRLVYDGKLAVTADIANYKLAGFSNLAPGSYFLRVKGATLNDNIKVVKTN